MTEEVVGMVGLICLAVVVTTAIVSVFQYLICQEETDAWLSDRREERKLRLRLRKQREERKPQISQGLEEAEAEKFTQPQQDL